MKIGLDASYSVGGQLSGIGVYSRAMLDGLPRYLPRDRFRYYYRPHLFLEALRDRTPSWHSKRPLLERGFAAGIDLFHGLNQRLPRTRFRRTIVTFHDLFVLSGEYSTPEFRRRFTHQAREAAARASLIIAVSNFTASQLAGLLGVFPASVRVIRHGVCRPAISTDPPQRQKIILSVGTIQKRKNTARLVEAFERMSDKQWRLVLAGSASGFGAGEIISRIEQSAARERIAVTGWISDAELTSLYRKASLFAFPSLDEGFGMPLLDAMAARLPILTSTRSALPEVAGDAALLVDPFSVEQIQDGLEKLAKDEALRRDLADRGSRRVLSFTWEAALEQTVKLYREVTG
ncbi:MAG: glycosyltransferase family 4 protein [Bryobacterales bacterium]|nr:glycosyltransferase family 4 protein [Bryobacterales bacterium]